jgi:hypothetical protein
MKRFGEFLRGPFGWLADVRGLTWGFCGIIVDHDFGEQISKHGLSQLLTKSISRACI